MPRRLLAPPLLLGAIVAALTVGPVPAQAAAPLNSLETIVSDMVLPNDEDLREDPTRANRRLSGPGAVVMGNDARGTHTPEDFRQRLVHPDYKDDEYWRAMVPWMEVFTHADNRAANTRVEMRNIKLYVLRASTGSWELVDDAVIDGWIYPRHGSGPGVPDRRPDLRSSSGSVQLRPSDQEQQMFHGWGNEIDYPTWDVRAVYVTMQARLVLDDPNGVDDRARSRYLLQMGADYYPETGVRVEDRLMNMYDDEGRVRGDISYFPGVGVGRAKAVTSQWQAFNFATLQDPEGRIEQQPGGSITLEELRRNPPPLE